METAEDLSRSGVSGQVEGMEAHARGKAEGMKAAAKGKAEEMKGKAEEMKGKAKGAAAQAKGKANETMDEIQPLYDWWMIPMDERLTEKLHDY